MHPYDTGRTVATQRRGRCVAVALAFALVVPALALARTPTPTAAPTNTDGPSPTATPTSGTQTATPTGTPAFPQLRAQAAPNPARSGQRVVLETNGGAASASYAWTQVAGVALTIENADSRVAQFTVPAVTEISVVTLRVTATGPNTGPSDVVIVLNPSDAVFASIVGGTGVPGSVVPVEVFVRSDGLAVTGIEHDLAIGPYAPLVDRGDGVPDCEVGAGLDVTSASFAFKPPGCAATGTCTVVHASLATGAPIPADSPAYRCRATLFEQPSPPGVGCLEQVVCQPGTATAASGAPLRLLCPEGANGYLIANYAFAKPTFEFSAEPAAPNVGDAVRVTFTVHGDGGLPAYRLRGIEPVLHGPTTSAGGGPLGAVSFDLQADCPGTASLWLDVYYETTAGCPGNTYFQFTNANSPVFPLIVREPGSARVTGRLAQLPTGCAGARVGAPVQLQPLGWTARTDEHGEFAFDGVPPGDYTLDVQPACGPFQCWPPRSVSVGEQDVDLDLCPQRLAGDACVGDCDLDGVVRVDELIVGVSMALGSRAFDSCPAIDAVGDGRIAVNEIIGAVAVALHGCS